MLTLTILHELEVDDLIDSTGMYLGAASVFAVSYCGTSNAYPLPPHVPTVVLQLHCSAVLGCVVQLVRLAFFYVHRVRSCGREPPELSSDVLVFAPRPVFPPALEPS